MITQMLMLIEMVVQTISPLFGVLIVILIMYAADLASLLVVEAIVSTFVARVTKVGNAAVPSRTAAVIAVVSEHGVYPYS